MNYIFIESGISCVFFNFVDKSIDVGLLECYNIMNNLPEVVIGSKNDSFNLVSSFLSSNRFVKMKRM